MIETNSDFRGILREAEAAYIRGDFPALEETAKKVLAGFTLVILTTQQHGPCFCILPTEALASLTERFRCTEPVRQAVSSTPIEGQETSSQPDGSPSETGLRSEVEPSPEGGRGNL